MDPELYRKETPMARFRFTPTLFTKDMATGMSPQEASDAANAALDAELADCTVVKGYIDMTMGFVMTELESGSRETHQALLYGVEPIEVKCEHPEDHLVTFPNYPGQAQCGKCGVKLKAKWEAE